MTHPAGQRSEGTKMTPSATEICEYAGHEWADAGGGLCICMVCEAEEWADSLSDEERP